MKVYDDVFVVESSLSVLRKKNTKEDDNMRENTHYTLSQFNNSFVNRYGLSI